MVHEPSKDRQTPAKLMVVNDSPGEECRIAILQDGHLEELFTERTATATNVGNIYKGRVTNVESGHPGRLRRLRTGPSRLPAHLRPASAATSPAPERTERVGKKIPRKRSRPPIQEALKRRRRGPRAGAQGGHRHQGADAHELPVHPRPMLVMMPRHGPGRRLPQGRG